MGSKSDLNIRMITSSQSCSIVHMGITNDITCSFCQRDCINHIVLKMDVRADILEKKIKSRWHLKLGHAHTQ